MRRALVIGVVLLAGCEATLGDSLLAVDAATVIEQVDAADPNVLPIDSAPACANGRVVYLNFEGANLVDAAASDATQNQASWMNAATGTAPAFLAGNVNRTQVIADITQAITAGLAQFPVTVVTTRPASGPYVMIIYGGTATQVRSNYSVAVNELDCDDSEKSDVAWITDGIGATNVQRYANLSLGAIGFGLGLTATSDPKDCMCGWANGCQSDQTVACTLTPGIPRDPAASQKCAAAPATQNEVATFTTAFCE